MKASSEKDQGPEGDGCSGIPRNFVQGGGVRQIQLRTEDRENGDMVAVAP